MGAGTQESIIRMVLNWILEKVLNFISRLVSRHQQNEKDKENAEEFEETLGPDKDRDERSKRAEDLLNGD